MLTEPPPGILDLLVVGGLTVDRFEDGSSAPGGSVLHIARAASSRGLRIGIITAAGPEGEARAGIAELQRRAAYIEAYERPRTTTFRHRQGASGRRLWLERLGGEVPVPPEAHERLLTQAILYAPVAGEVPVASLRVWDRTWRRHAILQGWLRSTVEGGEVEPVSLSDLDQPLLHALGSLDQLVASREDLVADGDTPHAQLTALRDAVGRRPFLVVTDGADGLWYDLPSHRQKHDRREHIPAPLRVDVPSTVGAGDILAAFLTIGTGVQESMQIVVEELEARKHA